MEIVRFVVDRSNMMRLEGCGDESGDEKLMNRNLVENLDFRMEVDAGTDGVGCFETILKIVIHFVLTRSAGLVVFGQIEVVFDRPRFVRSSRSMQQLDLSLL